MSQVETVSLSTPYHCHRMYTTLLPHYLNEPVSDRCLRLTGIPTWKQMVTTSSRMFIFAYKL